MRKRRIRRKPVGAGASTLTAEDLDAIRRYRANRSSVRYYSDLKAIDDPPKTPAPPTPDDSEK